MQTRCSRRLDIRRRRKRLPHSKGKRSKAPKVSIGKGKITEEPTREGCAGPAGLGRCKVDFRKREKGVLVPRTACKRPPTHEAKDTRVVKLSGSWEEDKAPSRTPKPRRRARAELRLALLFGFLGNRGGCFGGGWLSAGFCSAAAAGGDDLGCCPKVSSLRVAIKSTSFKN